jgi:hypothetical protein
MGSPPSDVTLAAGPEALSELVSVCEAQAVARATRVPLAGVVAEFARVPGRQGMPEALERLAALPG